MPRNRRGRMSKGRASENPTYIPEQRSQDRTSGEHETNPSTQDNAKIAVLPEHLAEVQKTRRFMKAERVKREHCNRIMKLQAFLRDKYRDHHDELKIEITEADFNDPTRFYHKMTYDIDYTELQPNIFEAFLAASSIKRDGSTCGYSHIRKFYDAILYGAKQSKRYLLTSFCNEIDDYISCVSKKAINDRREGITEAQDADAISRPLYERICLWSIKHNNCYLWSYTVMLWVCMARSASIDIIGLHNMYMGNADSVIWQYDDSKTDKDGKKVHPKNVYANPLNFMICPITAMACWISLNKDTFDKSDSIFLRSGKETSASKTYADQLKQLLDPYHSEILKYGVRRERVHPHGYRKGAGTDSTAGSTAPPPLPSVAMRGEWSQGTVFNIYFQFAATGDHYLGRLLSGLNPMKPEFSTLPPHFQVGMENKDVSEFVMLLFGPIIERYDDIHHVVGPFLLYAASLAYHSDRFAEIMLDNPNHFFNKLPIWYDRELLHRVKALTTTEKTPDMPNASGIPPHVIIIEMLKNLFKELSTISDSLENLTSELKSAVTDAITDNDIRNHTVSTTILEEKLVSLNTNLGKKIDEKFKTLEQLYKGNISSEDLRKEVAEAEKGHLIPYDGLEPPTLCPLTDEVETNWTQSDPKTPEHFVYHSTVDGRFYFVPEGWSLPRKMCNLRTAWELYCLGQPMYRYTSPRTREIKVAPIRPFHHFKCAMMPKKLWTTYRVEWRKVLRLMQGDDVISVPHDNKEEYLTDTYNRGFNRLKTRSPWIFEPNRKIDYKKWSISTWSKCTSLNYKPEKYP